MAKKSISDVLIKFKGDNKELDKSLDKSQKKLKKFTSSAVKRLKQMSVAMAAVGVAAAAYSIHQAMSFEGLNRAFKRMVSQQGIDADKFLATMKKMSFGTVSEMDIMKQANMGLMLGLKTDSLIIFMETAATIAQATGASAQYMFESLVTGTARQSRELLDNLGIMVDLGYVMQKYADTLGVTVDELTDQERKIAYSTAALEASSEKLIELGGFVIDTKAKWDQLITSFKDAAVVLGQRLMPEVDKILTWIVTNKDWMVTTFDEIFNIEITNFGDDVVKQLDNIKAWVDTNKGTLADIWDGFKTGIDMTITSLRILLASMLTVNAAAKYVMAVGGKDEQARWTELQSVSASTVGLHQEIGEKDWMQSIVGGLKAPGGSEGITSRKAIATATGPFGSMGMAAGTFAGRVIKQKIEIVLDSSAVEKFLTGQVVGVTNIATISGT